MRYRSATWLLCGAMLLGGCAEEVPPPSVDEFLADKIMLDAAMVRCSQNRSQMRYVPECINAREAANTLAREEEAERRNQLEAQSERKRAALRRAQEAADQARRRAAEAAQRRREADYLAIFEGEATATAGGQVESAPRPAQAPPPPQPQPGVPVPESEPQEPASPANDGDLQAIREELRRRQEQQPEPR